MKKNPLILILLVLLVLGFLVFSSNNNTPADSSQKAGSETGLTGSGPSVAKDTPEVESVEGAGVYTDYSEQLLANADNGPVILFFKAVWCTTCNALDRDIRANLKDIPEGTTILKVDYDSELAMRKKYDVRIQHTLVQVDADGNKVAMWTGSPKLKNLLSQII